ncbi:helix-turn-helix domain-containing protein [Kitasatospora sp. NPDC052868]|uniref:helix-turn-helix domain-containing protein n=1 Tax=Kitasatospora sp. NPDC052868 TaxID=3364060 RepID=UPI0037C9B41D
MLDGSPITEVAQRYGVSRQSVYTWKAKHAAGGFEGLREASRRPRTSPTRLPAEVEALVCEMRRSHPRWGARRIAFEIERAGAESAPSRATVHRVLTRNGLVRPQEQQHRRKYKRWQRETPMCLSGPLGRPAVAQRPRALLRRGDRHLPDGAAVGTRPRPLQWRVPQRVRLSPARYACAQ